MAHVTSPWAALILEMILSTIYPGRIHGVLPGYISVRHSWWSPWLPYLMFTTITIISGYQSPQWIIFTNFFSIVGDSDPWQEQPNHVEPVHVSGTKPWHGDIGTTYYHDAYYYDIIISLSSLCFRNQTFVFADIDAYHYNITIIMMHIIMIFYVSRTKHWQCQCQFDMPILVTLKMKTWILSSSYRGFPKPNWLFFHPACSPTSRQPFFIVFQWVNKSVRKYQGEVQLGPNFFIRSSARLLLHLSKLWP